MKICTGKILSIIVPCFNEEKNIVLFLNSIVGLNLEIRTELIFIDDGSTDSTWKEILLLKKGSSTCKIVAFKFTRNFGKEAAIEAGLKHCSGDLVITIDCDLQHPIELIPQMLELLLKNKDVHVINAVKKARQQESFLKKYLVFFYYYIYNFSTGFDLRNHSDYKLIDRMVVTEFLKLNEKNKFYRGLTSWLGFKSINIEFVPNSRQAGGQSWSLMDLFKYAKNSILSFSFIPLKLITWLGLSIFILSIVLTIDTLIKKYNGTSLEGFSTIIILQLVIGSLILFSLGIIGEYLSEIYKELKRRPTYVISSKSDDDIK